MTQLANVTTSQLDALLGQIQAASDIADLTEARARIEAARAWARVHKQVREMRLDLLRVEVEALVRIVELGGVNELPARDRKPAKHLASLSLAERATLVAQAGESSTTAAGMVRAIWTADDLEKERARSRRLGQALATHPSAPHDADMQRLVKESTHRVEHVLGETLDAFTTAGAPFTVNDFAEEVISAAGIGSSGLDAKIEEGVREVCRAAVLKAPVISVAGTILPRFVTAQDDEGHFFRVPVENATLAHLDQMIEIRRHQLAQDAAKLDELEVVADRLRSMPGADDEARIGGLIAADLTSGREVA